MLRLAQVTARRAGTRSAWWWSKSAPAPAPAGASAPSAAAAAAPSVEAASGSSSAPMAASYVVTDLPGVSATQELRRVVAAKRGILGHTKKLNPLAKQVRLGWMLFVLTHTLPNLKSFHPHPPSQPQQPPAFSPPPTN
jgi:hypothetical protein